MSTAQQFDDFVAKVRELLQHCDLTHDHPHNNSSVWRATTNMTHDNYFVMLKSASYYYFRGLDYVRNELQGKKIVISEGYLNDSYFHFIEEQKRNSKDLPNACSDWLNSLTRLDLKRFRFLIPISHYDYKVDIDLKIIRVVRLTNIILKEDFNVPDTHPFLTVSRLTENNHTDIFAIVDVESLEEKYAEEKAYSILDKFIYAVKLIDPGSYIRIRKNTLSQTGENILVKKGEKLSSSYRNHNIPVRIIPSPEFYTDLQPYWDKLSGFLYSTTLTDLQEVIVSALYWYGESDIRFDSRVKLLLNLITGLEWVVLHTYSRRNAKSDKFGKVCAKIFSGDEKYFEFYKFYYLKRNNIAHQKLVEIYKEDIDSLSINLRSLLLQLITLTDKYDNLKDLLSNEFGIN